MFTNMGRSFNIPSAMSMSAGSQGIPSITIVGEFSMTSDGGYRDGWLQPCRINNQQTGLQSHINAAYWYQTSINAAYIICIWLVGGQQPISQTCCLQRSSEMWLTNTTWLQQPVSADHNSQVISTTIGKVASIFGDHCRSLSVLK